MCMSIVAVPFTFTLDCYFSSKRKCVAEQKEVLNLMLQRRTTPKSVVPTHRAFNILRLCLWSEALPVHSRRSLRVIIVYVSAASHGDTRNGSILRWALGDWLWGRPFWVSLSFDLISNIQIQGLCPQHWLLWIFVSPYNKVNTRIKYIPCYDDLLYNWNLLAYEQKKEDFGKNELNQAYPERLSYWSPTFSVLLVKGKQKYQITHESKLHWILVSDRTPGDRIWIETA